MFILTACVLPAAAETKRLPQLTPTPLFMQLWALSEIYSSATPPSPTGVVSWDLPLVWHLIVQRGVFIFKVLAALAASNAEGSGNTDA